MNTAEQPKKWFSLKDLYEENEKLRAENAHLQAQIEDENSTRYKYKAECLERARDKLMAENERLAKELDESKTQLVRIADSYKKEIEYRRIDFERELQEARVLLDLRTEVLSEIENIVCGDTQENGGLLAERAAVRSWVKRALSPSAATPLLDAVREGLELVDAIKTMAANPLTRSFADARDNWSSVERMSVKALAKLRAAVTK